MNGAPHKTCCCTGHRNIPAEQLEAVRAGLRREIEAAAADSFTEFMSGFADGADLEFARIVLEARQNYPNITLTAALPCREWVNKKDAGFQGVLRRAAQVHVISEQYNKFCFRRRNQFLADHSQRVIAVFNGNPRTGTGQTLRMAEKAGLEVRIIFICPDTTKQ